MGVDLDLRKSLQDQANMLVNKAMKLSPVPIGPVFADFLKSIIFLSLRQGYVWGVTSNIQVSEMLLKDIKGMEMFNTRKGKNADAI